MTDDSRGERAPTRDDAVQVSSPHAPATPDSRGPSTIDEGLDIRTAWAEVAAMYRRQFEQGPQQAEIVVPDWLRDEDIDHDYLNWLASRYGLRTPVIIVRVGASHPRP